jgi:hypothetical protein
MSARSESPAEFSIQDKALNVSEPALDEMERSLDTFLARADVTAVYSEPVKKGETLVAAAVGSPFLARLLSFPPGRRG